MTGPTNRNTKKKVLKCGAKLEKNVIKNLTDDYICVKVTAAVFSFIGNLNIMSITLF